MNNAQLDQIVLDYDARRGERVLSTVHEFLGRFVAYPSEHARVAHNLWIIHIHLIHLWENTPRIAFLSPEPASGKTRALEITECLVPRPMEAVNMSPSALFRSVSNSDGMPTILFDEIDTIFGPRAKDNEDIRGLLNAGHRRGAKTYRSVARGQQVQVEAIEAFCPVALAGIGWLPDTLMSRSVIVRMRRRHQGESIEPFRRRIHGREGARIRDEIGAWVRSLPNQIQWPDLPREIQDRAADIWEPLIAVADLAGGKWSTLAREAAVALVFAANDTEPSLGLKLLADLRTVFNDPAFGRAEAMSSKELLEALHRLQESPWGDLKGKPLDERGLAYRLRQYGVKSKTVRIGSSTPKGYTRADLHDVWLRYLPAQAPETATSATDATKQNVVNVADVALLAEVDGKDDLGPMLAEQCCAHCHESGELQLCSVGGRAYYLHRECQDAWIAKS
jgi:Protein of unknown function (DUF3631)